jgi:hypothetical protein
MLGLATGGFKIFPELSSCMLTGKINLSSERF